jgi:catechol 2,3-dioxygenase-like lactoylglutathione lyase family enzyme
MSTILGCNVTIMVSNMDASIKFYTEVLGFKLKNRYGDHWADIEAPDMAIGLHPAAKDVSTGNNLSIGLRVADLNDSKQALEKQEIQFDVRDDGEVSLAHFADPDGNAFYLVQPKW